MPQFTVNLPTYCECDVFIAGGGPAGCAAAYAAAKQGARVFLAEATGCFGGMGTSGLVPFFTGYSDGVRTLCAGFGQMVFDRMKQNDGFGGTRGMNIRPEVLKRVYDGLMQEAGVQFLFDAKLVAVLKNGDVATHAVLSLANGLWAVAAKVFIDATGDGHLSALAGAECNIGNENGRIMPSSLCSMWSGIDWDKYSQRENWGGENLFGKLCKAIDSKQFFKIPDWHHTGISPANADTGCGNIGHIFGMDATDPSSRTAGWLDGRRLMPEFEAFYRTCIPGFEKATLASTASLLGVRESRRIVCDYTLVRSDFTNRMSFTDEIGHFAYGIDIHPYEPTYDEYLRFRRDFIDPENRYEPGEHYGIPYRSLTVKGFQNLLVAGRCISADNYMIASVRVMPGCFITGQAAGTAAAMAAASDGCVRNVEIKQLQDNLRTFGAYI